MGETIIQQFYFLLLTAGNFFSTCFTSDLFSLRYIGRHKKSDADWLLVIAGGTQGCGNRSSWVMRSLLKRMKKGKGSDGRRFMRTWMERQTEQSIDFIPKAFSKSSFSSSYPVTSPHQWKISLARLFSNFHLLQALPGSPGIMKIRGKIAVSINGGSMRCRRF